MVLLARASVARRLIRDGLVEPDVGLSYVVWPSEAVVEAERRVPTGTLVGRAYHRRLNA